MKLIFAGTPENAASTLSWLLASGHEVVAVLTRPDAPVGRKRIVTPSAVAQVAHAAGLPVIKTNTVTHEVSEQLARSGAALGVIVAYGALLKTHALEALPLGWLNLHYSLLPDWRGAAPVQNAILHGDRVTGVTLFQLDEGMDTGPILDSIKTEIAPGETSGALLKRLTELGNSLLSQTLPLVESGLAQATPQTMNAPARPANKLTRADALIDWESSAFQVERKVLGMNPEPMAFTTAGSQAIRILDAQEFFDSETETVSPGTLVSKANRVFVACGSNSLLELKQLQPAGKNVMNAIDWYRGASGNITKFDGGLR